MKTIQFSPVLWVPCVILLVPAMAMFLGADGWAWTTGDFVIAWATMTGVGLAYRLIARRTVGPAYRAATAIALCAAFLLLWVNGAVGLIGSEKNPANLLYVGVLLIAAAGTAVSRLKPMAMAKALAATTIAQFIAPLVALMIDRSDFSPGIIPVVAMNFFFVLMFAASAALFYVAAHNQAPVAGHPLEQP